MTTDLITGFRLTADTPASGTVTTSNERINRIHRMAQYSFASNMMTIFTDCPGREKQSYPADYTMAMGAIERNYDLASYLRGHMRHFAEGQSMADTFMRGNVALKVPVHDVGFTGQFGDEINWGNGIILVPAFLYELYGDLDTAATYYDEMVLIPRLHRAREGRGGRPARPHRQRRPQRLGLGPADLRPDHRHLGLLRHDRQARHDGRADRERRGRRRIRRAGQGHQGRLQRPLLQRRRRALRHRRRQRRHRRRHAGRPGLALDAGLVPKADRQAILDYLVENMYAFQSGDGWPHFSGGTIGLAPTVRALTEGGRDDVIWEALQSDTNPSYGFFLQPTTANPDGFTTIGEQWNRGRRGTT